jgi:wobble nucleotide-excising tRNase
LSEKEKANVAWQKLIDLMQTANTAIKANREAIESYKGQLAAENVQQLQQQVSNLQATKRRYDQTVVELINGLTTARTAATVAENAKRAARDSLDTLMNTTLDKYEKSINELLKDFGASFNIKGMGANFRGQAPRSEYGLLLRGKTVTLDGGPPSFSTTLSEGDKRTLAFAFFVASTLADNKLDSRIVVIDDPMCSFDLNRKHHTRSVLKKMYTKAEQLIVLAHDTYFLRDLRDALLKADKTASIAQFQLSLASGDYTDFSALDIDRECESDYFQHHRLLNEFTAGRNCDIRSVAKAIRPMLEGYLHLRFPTLIRKDLLFGDVVKHIKNAVSPNPLCHASGLVDALNEINGYAGQFHHDTNPGSADTVVITATELKTYVDKALVVVHRGV